MSNRFIPAALFFGICTALAAPRAFSQEAAGRAPSFEAYRVGPERNIFLRERPRPRPPGVPDRPPAPPPESRLVLTGIVRQGEEYIGFVEDSMQNVTTRVRVGETIANVRIASMTLDGIVHEKDGRTTEIGVGQSLSGSGFSPSTENAASAGANASAPEAPLTAPAAPVESSGGDVLQRLRERRQMELIQK